jgi:hypothetical protein
MLKTVLSTLGTGEGTAKFHFGPQNTTYLIGLQRPAWIELKEQLALVHGTSRVPPLFQDGYEYGGLEVTKVPFGSLRVPTRLPKLRA